MASTEEDGFDAVYFKVSLKSLTRSHQRNEICSIPLKSTASEFLAQFIQGYTDDALAIRRVVCKSTEPGFHAV